MAYHSTQVLGNLGKDPEMRYTPSGKPVTSFSVAVGEKWGEGKEHTEWYNVETWNVLAENCNKFLKKGSKVFVEGKMRTDTYTGDDGQQKRFTKLIGNRVEFLSPKGEDGPGAGYPDHQVPPVLADEDDLPF